MDTLIPKIDRIIEDRINNRSSFFQLNYFVIGREPTLQGRIHACIRELNSRKEALEAISLEIEDQYDQKRLSELQVLKYEKNTDKEFAEEQQIYIKQLQRKIVSIDNKIKELKVRFTGIEEESSFIIDLYEEFITHEEPKDWDSPEVQAEYWNATLTQRLQRNLMLGRVLDEETLSMVLTLPEDTPVKKQTLAIIKQLHESQEKKLTQE